MAGQSLPGDRPLEVQAGTIDLPRLPPPDDHSLLPSSRRSWPAGRQINHIILIIGVGLTRR